MYPQQTIRSMNPPVTVTGLQTKNMSGIPATMLLYGEETVANS